MLTDAQRTAIIEEAETWYKTPYRGWSCLKGSGVDCGQLLYGVFRALQFIPALVLPKDYSLQVAQHRASTEYVDLVAEYFREIPESEAKPADLVIYKLGLAYAHAAIIKRWPDYVIQAESRHGVCGAHGTQTPLFRHASKRFFTLKDEYCGGVL